MVIELVNEGRRVLVGVRVAVGEGPGVIVSVSVAVSVIVLDGSGEDVRVSVGVAVSVIVTVNVTVSVTVGEAVLVWVGVSENINASGSKSNPLHEINKNPVAARANTINRIREISLNLPFLTVKPLSILHSINIGIFPPQIFHIRLRCDF